MFTLQKEIYALQYVKYTLQV